MTIARVFPRRTKATPDDALVFTDAPPMLGLPEIDEVHVSVAFSWDMPQAEWLEYQWRILGIPVRVGGPALKEPGGEFEPGMYLKKGYTITSRGCPNRCPNCAVPEREGYVLRELPIKDGYNLLDDNLLACSDQHIKNVFAMLHRQPENPIFSGGLEAKLLKPWHAEELRKLRPQRMYFAYDTPDDYEPLVQAGKLLQDTGFTVAAHTLACYVLIGYPGDTMDRAEKRLMDTIRAGFMPYAMLFRDYDGAIPSKQWEQYQRAWLRPQIVAVKMKEAHR